MTAPYFGKREPGALTAASPGDTLYLQFGTYNDSGDSEALTGLAVTDIEVFKNGLAPTRTTDSGYSLISDTGQIGDRVGLYRCSIQLFNTADDTGHYESGAWYQAAIDAITVDGKNVRFWLGSWEIGRQRVDVRALNGDTGASNYLKNTFLNGFNDTGVTNRFDRIQSDVDTGLRVHIDDSDTGLKDHINDIDTGLRAILNTGGVNVASLRGDTGAANWLKTVYTSGFTDTGLYSRLDKLAEDTGGVNINAVFGDTGAANWLRAAFANGFADTGLYSRIDKLAEDTGGVNINSIQGDTGAAGWLKATFLNGFADTGLYSRLDKLPEDTGGVNINSIQGDTGAAAWLRATFASGFTDTGLNERLARIQSDVDTGLRVHIDDSDTGIKDAIADLDTGLRDHIDNTDTGLRARLNTLAEDTGGVNVNAIAGDTGAASWLRQVFANGFTDTGIYSRISALAEDTGGVSINAIAGDTGAAGWLKAAFQNGFADTGINDRLAKILADTDTGIQGGVTVTAISDTGVNDRLNKIELDTGASTKLNAIKTKTDSLTYTVAGQVDANVQSVNDVTVTGTGASGSEWGP